MEMEKCDCNPPKQVIFSFIPLDQDQFHSIFSLSLISYPSYLERKRGGNMREKEEERREEEKRREG